MKVYRENHIEQGKLTFLESWAISLTTPAGRAVVVVRRWRFMCQRQNGTAVDHSWASQERGEDTRRSDCEYCLFSSHPMLVASSFSIFLDTLKRIGVY